LSEGWYNLHQIASLARFEATSSSFILLPRTLMQLIPLKLMLGA